MILLDLCWDFWKNKILFIKNRAKVLDFCLWEMELGFWSYVLICFVGSSSQNVASSPKIPKSWSFLRYNDFIGIFFWFWRKRSPVCEKWSYFSGIMAWHVFWVQVGQMNFLGRRPQNHEFFLRFHKFIGLVLWFWRKLGSVC